MNWNQKKEMATQRTPAFKLVRVKEGEGVLSPEEQTIIGAVLEYFIT